MLPTHSACPGKGYVKTSLFLVVVCLIPLLYLNNKLNIKIGDLRIKEFQCGGRRYEVALISFADLKQKLKTSPRHICNCPDTIVFPEDGSHFTMSNCSDEATLAGENQKVVSFSFYSNLSQLSHYVRNKYFVGIKENLGLVKRFYPDWKMRLYTNFSLTPEICGLVCSDRELHICNVTYLIPNATQFHPMSWRFLPLGDPTVRKFVSRDLDSRIGQRELDAVEEWENSNFSFHTMRDHPLHKKHIQGGMWGADNSRFCWDKSSIIRNQMFGLRWKSLKYTDQDILRATIYKLHGKDIISHDSYYCKKFRESVPFPKQRRKHSYDFVGQPISDGNKTHVANKSCPRDCRPVYGKHWLYC